MNLTFSNNSRENIQGQYPCLSVAPNLGDTDKVVWVRTVAKSSGEREYEVRNWRKVGEKLKVDKRG